MNGAPAEAATSRSPVASTTILPRMAWRPSLLSTTTPLAAPLAAGAAAPGARGRVDLGLGPHVVGEGLEPVGIEGGGIDEGLRLQVRGKVEPPPARPLAPHGGVGAPIGLGGCHRQSQFLQ